MKKIYLVVGEKDGRFVIIDFKAYTMFSKAELRKNELQKSTSNNVKYYVMEKVVEESEKNTI